MTRPVSAIRHCAVGLCAVLLGYALQNGPAQASSEEDLGLARAKVEVLSQDLAAIADVAPDLTEAELIDIAGEILGAHFDMRRIAAAAIGRSAYRDLTEEQRADYIDAFAQFTFAAQARSLSRFRPERLSVDTVEGAPGGLVMVRTRYLGEPDDVSTVDFMLFRGEDRGYRVVDLVLDGTVSQLALRRAEFASVLKQRGYNGLMALLKERTAALRNVPQ